MRRWTPAIVFVVALAVRLIVVVQLNATAIFRTPELDSYEYLEWAQRIASGDFTWPAAPPHGPGYPMLLALMLVTGRGSIFAVHVMQAILGAMTAVVISAIATRVYGQWAGLLAGLLAAAYSPMVLAGVSLYAEGFFVLLLSCSLLALVSLESRPALMSFLCGSALGIAIIVRPTAAILIPVYAWPLWRHARRVVAIFAIAVLYPVLPVIAHNWAATGDVLAIQSGGGLNFYIGNEPRHDGTAWARPGGSWDWVRGEAWRAGVRGATAEDRWYFRKALGQLRPSLFVRKVFWLIQNEEIRDSHSFYFFQQRSAFLHLPQFGLILAFAAVGVFARRRERATWLLLGYAVAMSITVVALVVGSRYRMPVMPALLVLGGGFAGSMVTRRTAWTSLAIFFAAIVTSAIGQHAATHNFAEEWAMEGIALGKEESAGAAQAAFRKAIAIDPNLAIAWTGLGDLELKRGNLTQAESFYRRSIAADPHHALAYTHLAFTRAAAGDRAGAIALLQKAVSIRADRDALYNLAGYLFAQGDRQGARLWLDQLLLMQPDDPEARMALARVEQSRFNH